MNTRWVKVFATLWWDEDRRDYGFPIEFNIHTRRRYYLIRPFARAQAYDWKLGVWTYPDIVWKHVVSSPENPEIWEALERSRSRKHV